MGFVVAFRFRMLSRRAVFLEVFSMIGDFGPGAGAEPPAAFAAGVAGLVFAGGDAFGDFATFGVGVATGFLFGAMGFGVIQGFADAKASAQRGQVCWASSPPRVGTQRQQRGQRERARSPQG